MSDETAISPETARHVLWLFGRQGGVQPGSFTQRLMAAIDAADVLNQQKIANEYPDLVAAIRMAGNDDTGIATLQQIAGNDEVAA
ncbi:hypothetical protein [Streptomyces zaomyceticus]|uniref:hypothetical protein n=1 Tax=Streptomyces zaomyceticus TaxID=68286 RepID=UPI002E138F85|nr:hypothetical protein OG237_06305 [Streptomyces zaomyceticus]